VKITRRKLIDLAHREAQRRAEEEDIVSAYLTGSVARGEPLLGGTADIDLVLIHKDPPPVAREVVPLSQDIHLDIAHHDQALYGEPRKLRTSPWLGPMLYDPLFLLDPDHFLEWAQASARSQFNRADYRVARASALLEDARSHFDRLNSQHSLEWLTGFTQTISDGANAVALLAGPPATGRRLVLTLKQRTSEADQPGIFEAFLQIVGLESADKSDLPDQISEWARAFELASAISTDPRLASCRLRYNLAGFEALDQAGWPEAVEWGLLSTWQIVAGAIDLMPNINGARSAWDDFLDHLDLGESAVDRRVQQADRFLDRVEEILDEWAGQHGA
jgi:hypothetical protein